MARGEEIVNDVLELGLEGVELEYRISAAMYRGMKTRLKEALTVLSIHNYFPKPEEVGEAKGSGDLFLLSSSDREERLRAVKYSIRTIEQASDLGARAVVLHLGRVDIPDDVPRVSEAYKTLTEDPQEGRRLIDRQIRERAKRKKKNLDAALFSLEALNREAERRGVYLGVENRVHYFEIPDFEEIGLILDRFGGGRVRYWHDVGHAHVQEKLGLVRQKDLLEAYGDRLVGVHLHDVTAGINDHFAPGQGELNFEQIKPFLKPSHIKILEVHPKVDRDGLREGIRFVTSLGI